MFVSPPPSFFRTWIYRIDADASLGGRYCLPDSSSLHGYSPETASRVTLALLGTGFQPALNSMFVVGNKFCLEDNTERSESNP